MSSDSAIDLEVIGSEQTVEENNWDIVAEPATLLAAKLFDNDDEDDDNNNSHPNVAKRVAFACAVFW